MDTLKKLYSVCTYDEIVGVNSFQANALLNYSSREKFDFFSFTSNFQSVSERVHRRCERKTIAAAKKNRPTPQGKNSFDISVKIEKLH